MKENRCLNCDNITSNPKFCSKSCSVSYSNVVNPKRKKKFVKCSQCDSCVYKNGYKRCLKCSEKYKLQIRDNTLREILIKNGHTSLSFTRVRGRAKTIAKKLGWNSCICCGYSKHIHICHIKPVSEFDLDTKLSVVNAKNNIVPLCPNCHKEFDHDLMSEENRNKILRFTESD